MHGAAVTMADVAERAGVSRALVSIVFRGVPGASPENRERVLRAAAELDYQPDHRARMLGSKRSRTVGVLFGLHREFHGELVERLYREVEGTGWDLALGACAPSRDERRAVRTLVEQRCEALVLLGPTLSRAALGDLARRLPVVVVARSVRALEGVDVVRTDDVAGARLAVEHVVGLGHRRLAHVDGGRAPGAAERRRGFCAAATDLGAEQAVVLAGGLAEEHGEHAAEGLRAHPDVTAVTAFNDHCAVGLMTAVRARGVRVPEDLSVVGYDDSRVAGLAGVALTTVAQDAAAMARHALGLAIRRAEDPRRSGEEVVVPPTLVARGTTAEVR